MPSKKKKSADPKRTELLLIVDRSGSMHAIHEDVIGGLNSFFEEQKAQPGECDVSILQFDDTWEWVRSGVPLKDIPEWTPGDFAPRGMTALLDAIARGVGELETRVGNAKDDPLKVVVIFTDGLENASREVTRDEVFAKVEVLTKAGWGFIYLGANQDAIAEGANMGFDSAVSNNYAATPDAAKAAMSYSTRAVRDYRNTGQAAHLVATSAEANAMTGGLGNDTMGSTEAAQFLGISKSTLYRMQKKGSAPVAYNPSPGTTRYKRQDLEQWLIDNSTHRS